MLDFSSNIVHCTQQHLFLLYPRLFFTLSSKLTSSANHFLLSLFFTSIDGQFSGSIWLSSVLFISQSFSLYHSRPFHFHRFTAEYCCTVSGNKPPSNQFCLVGFAGIQISSLISLLLSHLTALCIYSSFNSVEDTEREASAERSQFEWRELWSDQLSGWTPT